MRKRTENWLVLESFSTSGQAVRPDIHQVRPYLEQKLCRGVPHQPVRPGTDKKSSTAVSKSVRPYTTDVRATVRTGTGQRHVRSSVRPCIYSVRPYPVPD